STHIERGANKLPAILRSPRPGNESIARPDLAAVARQRPLHAVEQPICHGLGGVEVLHQNDSSTSSVTIWGFTSMSGCTPRMRKACCTVSLNTGAATTPP